LVVSFRVARVQRKMEKATRGMTRKDTGSLSVARVETKMERATWEITRKDSGSRIGWWMRSGVASVTFAFDK
jgi:hypothetical protein